MAKFSQKESEYLQGQQLGRIATTSRDHSPHVTPVAFASDEERLYINILPNSKKVKNIKRDPRIQFVVDDILSFEDFRGVLISGKAELFSSGKFHVKARNLIYEKYPKFEEQYPIEEGGSPNILIITPTKILNWGPLSK